jgi:hypothetical protein
MAQNQTTFSDRLQRIEETRSGGGMFRRRRKRREERGVVVHPDGFAQPILAPRRRLRFGFPLKGLILACIFTVLVKAYLMWSLGDEIYGAAVVQLLNGNPFERAAGLVLAPDQLSNWVMDVYQYVYRFFLSVATALEEGTLPDFA